MSAFERVLALVDLREDARDLARYAIETAASFGAELTLLHVVNSNRPRGHNSGLSWPECAMARAKPACVVHRAVTHGATPDAVVRYADFIDADLIVVGDESRSIWKRLRIEPMAERIAAATNRPILTAKPRPDGTLRLVPHPRILCILGAEDSNPGIVEYAQWLTEHSNGELTLYAAANETGSRFPLDLIDGLAPNQSASEVAARLQRLHESLRIPCRNVVAARASSRELHATIERHKIDLVVAPRRARGGSRRAHLEFGAVLRGVSRPLLSIASPMPRTPSAGGVEHQAETLELSARHK